MASTGFFKSPHNLVSSLGVDDTKVVVDIGGKAFDAVAAALIIHFKDNRINDASLKKILTRLFAYYPHLVVDQPCLTPDDRMTILLKNTRKSDMVECMAYVLRQLAVDEIYALPLQYREVFNGLDANTSQNVLRDPNTSLPLASLKALSHAINVNITLSFVEHNKELRRRNVFGGETTNQFESQIVVQVQGDHYFPRVKNKADFAYVGQLAVSRSEAVIEKIETKDISDMLGLIDADNRILLQTFIRWRQNLLIMIQTNELTTAKLISLYIKFLPVDLSDVENNDEFFAQLQHLESKPVASDSEGGKLTLNEQLASAIAGWISKKQIDTERFFETLENQSTRASTMAR